MFEPMLYRSNWLNLKSLGVKWCFAMSFLLLVLFFPFLTKGAPTLFFDNFENYNVGDLDGQNGWLQSGSATSTWWVVDNLSHTGTKSIMASGTSIDGTAGSYKFSENSVPTGQIYFWFYIKDNAYNSFLTGTNTIHGPNPYWALYWDTCGASFCKLYYQTSGSPVIFIKNISTENWHSAQFKWDTIEGSFKFAYNIDEGGWSDWKTSGYQDNAYLDEVKIIGRDFYIDDISDDNYLGGISITNPPSDSDISQSFSFEGSYDKQGGDYNKLMIILEQWNASSTCPLAGSQEEQEEQNNGWFIYQSLPFFSNDLLTENGDFTGEYPNNVDDLRTGYYNCTRCYFINEISGTISDEQCRGYKLNVIEGFSSYLPPYNLPFENWDTYYSAHTDKYATSTPLFSAIASAISPLADRIGNFVVYVKTYFDLEQASAKGTTMGQAIPVARGYLTEINNFFGGLPISDFVIFYILSVAVIICYKIIYRVIRLIKP